MSEIDNLLSNQDNIFFRLRERSSALARYALTVSMLHKTDVSQDKTYQKTFCGFYRVRRNQDWRIKYFMLLEQNKSKMEPGFEKILDDLLQLTSRLEASFASKLVATINPDLPVYDSIVRANLGLPPRSGTQQVRFKLAIEDYNAIKQHSATQTKSDSFHALRANFDQVFPEYRAFSDTKVLDLLLWQNR